MKTELKFHNPDNLETAGDPPWRFLVEGEVIQEGDEFFDLSKQWHDGVSVGERCSSLPGITYRTQRAIPAPQPGGGGEGMCILHPKQSEPCDICEREEQEHIEKFGTNAIPPTPPIALPVREKLSDQEVLDIIRHNEGDLLTLNMAFEIKEHRVAAAALSRELEAAKGREAVLAPTCASMRSSYDQTTDRLDETTRELERVRAELEEAKAERDAARHTRDRLAEHQAETERRLSAEITALRAAPRSEGAIESAIQRFEDKERGIPQAHMAAELVKELRTALAALSPRSETEGRDKERLDALDLMAVEMVEGTDCVSLTLFMKPGQKIRDAIDDLTSSVLARDEKGAGE